MPPQVLRSGKSGKNGYMLCRIFVPGVLMRRCDGRDFDQFVKKT
ncbi:hypothetical protein QUB60_15350 [Microcoleus sp. A2-C5]|nr:hypothetical protein [Lyngbya sp. CCAP 1446/10]